jgi:hypothetical protein
MASTLYVRPAGSAWVIVEEGHRRGTVRERTKTAAVARARKLVRSRGGGEVRVMNSDGKMTASDAVMPPRSAARSRRAPSRRR